MNFYEIEVDQNEAIERLVSIVNPSECANIPSCAILGRIERSDDGAVIQFFENREFLEVLHRCVEFNGPFCPALQKEANRQCNGVVFLIDRRVADIFGNVLPEDIIGAFEVKGGQVHPETYRPNSNHKIYSDKGFFSLNPYLESKLLNYVQERAKA